MNERIKKLRKKLGMTQEKFSLRIKLSRNFIAQIESGAKIPSDRTISDICREFQVSEEWLKNGTGEMFVTQNIDDEFAMIAGEIMVSDEEGFKTAIIEAWKRPELRKLVKEYMKVLQEKQ